MKFFANPFYIGVIRIKASGESYDGVHQPLIPKSLFDRVQDVLDGSLLRDLGRIIFFFGKIDPRVHTVSIVSRESYKKAPCTIAVTRATAQTLSVREDVD